MSTYIPVIYFFCRPEIVPEISLEELEEPLLSASSTNDSAIAVESEVRKLEIFQKVRAGITKKIRQGKVNGWA